MKIKKKKREIAHGRPNGIKINRYEQRMNIVNVGLFVKYIFN